MSRKIIWTCWFQGRDQAPPLVQACFKSWEHHNPGWELRCLDIWSIGHYVPLAKIINLTQQRITAASLSDIVRIMLLHEYGGVWVDATLFCNQPLDSWLPEMMIEGFFAFAAPAATRPLASWFISAASGHYLVSAWYSRVVAYWSGRMATDDYYWFHHLFRALCETDTKAGEIWSRVPKQSADGPHALQTKKRYALTAKKRFFLRWKKPLKPRAWKTPVFKLSHRMPDNLPEDSLLNTLLEIKTGAPVTPPPKTPTAIPAVRRFASLKVSTENLGDHVQIIAAKYFLARFGIMPENYIDRDDEISSAPILGEDPEPVGIMLNGWFKTNRAEWPPHPKLLPIFLGFHIRLFQCPELLGEASLDYFRHHQPIGCRDVYTERLLRAKRIAAFTSHCLSLSLPRRVDDPKAQSEIFVVSRDERITALIQNSIGTTNFVGHYSSTRDFNLNMAQAAERLERYRTRARLIVTTLLHCALPAIAMGIPVVMIYPINNKAGHASDQERFSSLREIIRIYNVDEIHKIDWNPAPVDVSGIKLTLLDRFSEMAGIWGALPETPIGPIAPASLLPPP